GPKTSIICSPMTSLKTSIKTITYLSDIGCLEIQGASLVNAEVPLTIESDTGRLSEFIDFKSKASSAEFSKLLTLGVMSGGSTY
ncbi:hypothetical protein ACTFYP_06330, partial [Escherichia coli]